MKKLLLLTLLLAVGCGLMAAKPQEPKRGYRQFYDVETFVSSWMVADNPQFTESAGWVYNNVYRKCFADVLVSTAHGFQFNKNFFLGAGLCFGATGLEDNWTLGAFVDIRTDQHFGKYTPYAALRCGILTHLYGYFYISPTVGYRFNFGHRTNLNIGLGLCLQYMGKERLYETFYSDLAGELLHITVGKDPAMKPFFTFRVGVDF